MPKCLFLSFLLKRKPFSSYLKKVCWLAECNVVISWVVHYANWLSARLSCCRVDSAVNHGVSRRVTSQREKPEAKTGALHISRDEEKHSQPTETSQTVCINTKLFVSPPYISLFRHASFVNEDSTSCWSCCCRKLRKFTPALRSILKDFLSECQCVRLSSVREEGEGWKSVNVPRFVLLQVESLHVSSAAELWKMTRFGSSRIRNSLLLKQTQIIWFFTFLDRLWSV